MLSESTVQGDETDDVENHAHSFVFASKNWMTTEDRLLVLIHGSGVVRAGQWARRYSNGTILCSKKVSSTLSFITSGLN